MKKNKKTFSPLSAEEHRLLAAKQTKTHAIYILSIIAVLAWCAFAYFYHATYQDIIEQEAKLISRSVKVKVAQAQIETLQNELEEKTWSRIIIGDKDSLAFKNNNPGNLKYAGQKNSTNGYGGFAKYNTPEEGFRGLIRQIILDQSRGLPLDQFIKKYAPDSDGNNTPDYIYMVSAWLNVSPIINIKELNPIDLATQIIKIECRGRVE